MMSAKILVTGGHGLVGYALQQIAPQSTLFLNKKNGDLRNLETVRQIFNQHQPEFVIHLAAKVAGVKTNAQKKADMFTENVQINTNVLNVAQEYKVKKLVAVLSNCVFQENPPRIPTEEDIHQQMPFHGHLGYGYAKRMMDLQIHLLQEQYGCQFTSITPVTIIGPNDNWDFNESHVAGSLIQKCYLAKKNNTPLEVWGTGNAIRQFVSSHDIAHILLNVIKDYHEPSTLIVAPDQETSIRQLAETIAKIFEFKGEIIFDATKPEGELKRILDNRKFKNIFPSFQFMSLEKSLQSAMDWYLKNIAPSI